MLPARPIQQENPLWISWHDTQNMGTLTTLNVMDYFCRKSNPFYDRVCNNETIRMQRLGAEHLENMTGVEYVLLHVAEPSLYVIRKQHRHSPIDTTPIADYYIIDGMVYKAPDLGSVLNSRIMNTISNLSTAFDEVVSYSRYHPSKGYYWDFNANKSLSELAKQAAKKDDANKMENTGTEFQVKRVDLILQEVLRKFPIPNQQPALAITQQQQQQQLQQQLQQMQINQHENNNANELSNSIPHGNAVNETGMNSTQSAVERMEFGQDMPPPEKKPKI